MLIVEFVFNDIKHKKRKDKEIRGRSGSEKKERQNSVVEWNLWYVLAGSDVEV